MNPEAKRERQLANYHRKYGTTPPAKKAPAKKKAAAAPAEADD